MLDLQDLVQRHSDQLSIILVLFIVVVAIIFFIYIAIQKRNDNLLSHRGVIEMMPSLVSTLGVLGTFAGITLGLFFFDTSDLTKSIPLLLDGLKTAFFTSLAGMVGSMILSGQVNKLFDEKTGGLSDSEEAAHLIVSELQSLKNIYDQQANIQGEFYDKVSTQINNLNTLFTSAKTVMDVLNSRQLGMYNAVESIGDLTTRTNEVANNIASGIRNLVNVDEEINSKTTEVLNSNSAIATFTGSIAEVSRTIKDKQSSIEGKTESLLISIGNIEDSNKGLLEKTTEQNSRIGEMMDHTEALVSGQEEISQHVLKLGDKLHGEVVDIEDKMENTNKLLKDKFDEFAELLKKSNTEALVEVMKKVTEQFQKQMSELINKLVQENFEQLNKSVERLNTWQMENKEMIQSLTSQYREMSQNFEATSTSLSKVDEDTRQLVSEGGKLRQIVDSLNKVIVEDEKFIKISTDLQKTTELTKTNYEQFDEATKKLNDWVKKQRGFVDGVMVLIQKLEELNKIRDYGEQFWKETKESMNEGVRIIKDGTDTLNQQITGLDRQFYSRLSTTLTELDNCIQAFVIDAEKRNNY